MINISKIEQNRLAKLNLMLDELRGGKNVQNRRLATWLTKKEFESFEGQKMQGKLEQAPQQYRQLVKQYYEAIARQK